MPFFSYGVFYMVQIQSFQVGHPTFESPNNNQIEQGGWKKILNNQQPNITISIAEVHTIDDLSHEFFSP
jgi:hypothetical protein